MKTGAEAIRALATQLPAFRQKLSDGWYQMRIAGQDVSTSGYKRCSCSGIYSFTTGYDRRKLVAVGAALHLSSSSCRVLSSRCTNPVAIRYRSVWLCPDAGADF
ncbi:tail protein [Escherichia coli O145:H25 str. 07-3858]|nr:tail protein [Escherichia coli O145:H25 str. 07-3858]